MEAPEGRDTGSAPYTRAHRLRPVEEDLEDFVDSALAVPGGPTLGSFLLTERHLDTVLHHLERAELQLDHHAPGAGQST